MSLLVDHQIEALARAGMIAPYHDGTKEPGKISSGLSSMGYDLRVGWKFKVFSPIHAAEIDPKNFDPRALEEVDLTPIPHKWYKSAGKGWFCDNPWCSDATEASEKPELGCCKPIPNFIRIPPHSFILAESVEVFDIPRDILVVVLGKSTYARTGLIVNVTPGEPEWKGRWTIEISNTTPLPARVYCGEGIAQCLFFRGEQPVRTSYADKKGKYAGQTGITTPFVEGTK